MTQALSPGGTTITFVAEAFTGNVSTASTLNVPANKKLRVLGGCLTVTGNTAACPIQLKGSTTGTYAATRIELHGTLAATGFGAQPTSTWYFGPLGEELVAGEELVVGGGATAGVLDGWILVTLIPT